MSEIKEKRNLSGIYFRFKNLETNKFENRVFEDLPEESQKEMMNGKDIEWVKSLSIQLAQSLRGIGDQFDIMSGISECEK